MGYALAVQHSLSRSETPPDPLLAVMAGVSRGEEKALGALYGATSARVYGLALHLLRERESAEEATLDVFIQIWRTASRYDPARGSVLSWILTLARTRSIDTLRSRARRTGRETPLASMDDWLDPTPGPDQNAEHAEKAVWVRRVLGTLPPEQRLALEAAYFGGLSHSEVAETLGIPLGTAKTRIRDGLSALRRALAGREKESA